jgi:hypothetical protein
MQFLIQRGHSRLVPPGGLAEFPDAILNAKRLDLYNLYKEVIIHTFFFGWNKEVEELHVLLACFLI